MPRWKKGTIKFTQLFQKTDTLAAQLAAAGTSATLTTGSFGTPSGKQLLVVDYDVPAKREVIIATIAGTALTNITRAVDGTADVTHAANANVIMAHVPRHYLLLADAIDNGWVEEAVNETWVYASASTFTIAGIDVTTKYTKGTKLRLKQGGGFKYYVVASSSFSTNTTVTVIVNTDYVVANAGITDNAYSYMENPQGFPHYFAYTSTYTGFSAVPTQATRYSVRGKTVTVSASLTNELGTSDATTFTMTMPVASESAVRIGGIQGLDNTSTTKTCRLDLAAGSATAGLFTAMDGSAWTGSATKGVSFVITYEMD